ncbi:MAG: two-component regulator propeller domain-containing protein [Bacteroidales bacterium]|nr:two-component regulator propeller domain-containing protein [Bacteroidales bacterium]
MGRNLHYLELTILLSICIPLQTHAISRDIDFQHISYKGNLSQSTVNAILKDRIGFVWFGTEDGLNKYDGTGIRVYKHDLNNDNSISNSAVWSIFEDSEGTLWVGTFNGLNRYNKDTDDFTRLHHEAGNSASLTDNYVRAIAEDTRGDLWVGTNKGLNKIDRSTLTATNYLVHSNNTAGFVINDLLVDHLGTLWIATGNGLFVYNDKNDSFNAYRLPAPFLDNDILSVFEDQQGVLWIGSNTHGMFIFDRQNLGFKKYPILLPKEEQALRISAIRSDQLGNIWIGSSHGLIKLVPATGETQRFVHDPFDEKSLSENEIRSLYVEKNGFVWIGTPNTGVNVVNPYQFRFRHIMPATEDPVNQRNNNTRSFAELENGKLLAGKNHGGISVYDPVADVTVPFGGSIGAMLQTKSVLVILAEKQYYWIGTRNSGLIRYDRSSDEIRQFRGEGKGIFHGNAVTSILRDREGVYWIGTNGFGLHLYDPEKDLFTQAGAMSDTSGASINSRISSVIEDRFGDIWIGTAGGGVTRYLRARDRYEAFNIGSDSLRISFDYILTILEDATGNIWFGTFGNGLISYDRESKQFDFHNENNGLPNNVIYGILQDDKGYLWLSHNQGISMYDPLQEVYKNYDYLDGLQGNEFNSNAYHKLSNGMLAFGGPDGFNVFHPDSVRKETREPPVTVFTGLRISNEQVPIGVMQDGRKILNKSITFAEQVNLLHSDRDITFEFAALDYAVPEKNRYRYRFEGTDNNWIDLGKDNHVTFHNLPTGHHVLNVAGTGTDGVWPDQWASIAINVRPPFYATPVFLVLAALILAGLLILAGYLRIKNLKRKQTALEKQVENKTREISQQRDALRKQNEELEANQQAIMQERDRTAEFARRLDETNQSKLQFFTNISHEFRTPLTLILGYIEKFLTNPAAGKAAERIEDYRMIEKNANRLLKLINRLMQFRKLTNQQTILNISENNLVDFIRGHALLYKNLADKKEIEYTFESRKKELLAWFDPEKMEEVITNLLSNAFKFSQRGSAIRITVGQATEPAVVPLLTEEVDDPGNYFYFQVSDNGIGIPEDKLNLIFRRFYQAGQAYETSEIGAGIGLHISEMIMHLHKGFILVRSEPEKGSDFTVLIRKGKEHIGEHLLRTIPGTGMKSIINDEEFIINEESLRQTDRLDATIEHLSKKDLPRILVLEDNHELRTYITSGLDTNYRVMGAGSGEEAQQLLEEFDPEVIICDVLLPGKLNGFEFTEQLKSNLATSHIPVIMLTALDSLDQKIMGLEKGADIYMTKPFSLRELKAHINGALQLRIALKQKFREQSFFNVTDLEISEKDESFIQKTIRIIEEGMVDPNFNIASLCDTMHMSQTKLYRKIKALTDMTITDFIRGLRLRKAAAMLLETEKNVSEIAYEVGFNDPNYFGKCFKAQYGYSPSEYIRENTVKRK